MLNVQYLRGEHNAKRPVMQPQRISVEHVAYPRLHYTHSSLKATMQKAKMQLKLEPQELAVRLWIFALYQSFSSCSVKAR